MTRPDPEMACHDPCDGPRGPLSGSQILAIAGAALLLIGSESAGAASNLTPRARVVATATSGAGASGRGWRR